MLSKLTRQVSTLNLLQNDVMHPSDSVFEMVYVDLENIELVLFTLLNQMCLDCLILPNLVIHIGFDVHREILLRFLGKLLSDLTL